MLRSPSQFPDRLLPSRAAKSGFTLLEVLAALAVLAIATQVFVTMFYSSYKLNTQNRRHRIAIAVAEERLAEALRSPRQFTWPALESLSPGVLAPVAYLANDIEAELPVDPPLAMPLGEREFNRELELYGGYTWRIFATRPSADANAVQAVVVVRWNHRGRELLATVSSLLPPGSSKPGAAA